MPRYQTVGPARRFRTTNENASSFVSKVATITEPTNDGVLNLMKDGVLAAPYVMLWPFLLGSNDDVTSMRVIGWRRALKDGKTDLWFPTPIAEFSCTAGAAVGVAGAAVLDTEAFCDLITPVATHLRDHVIAAGTAIMSDYEVLSPGSDLIGHIIMPVSAFEKLELTSDQTTGTSTFNCLYAFQN